MSHFPIQLGWQDSNLSFQMPLYTLRLVNFPLIIPSMRFKVYTTTDGARALGIADP